MDDEVLRLTLHAAPVAIAYTRLLYDEHGTPVDSVMLEMNPEFERITGAKSSQAIGKRRSELFSPAEPLFDDWLKVHTEVIKQNKGLEFEHYVKSKNKYFRVFIYSPKKDYFALIVHDITQEKKEIQEKTTILMTMNDIIFELDEQLTFCNIFTSDDRHLFLPRDQIINRKLDTLFPPELSTLLLTTMEKVQNSTQEASVVYPSPLPNDNRWFKADIFLREIDCSWRYIVRIADITEKRKTERDLREANLRLNLVAEHSRTLVWQVDQHGMYTYVSEAVRDVFGYEVDEIVGKHYFYDLHPEPGREEFKTKAFETFGRRVSFSEILNPIMTKSGRIIWISTYGLPIFGEDGSFHGYQGSDMDITEKKQADDGLKASEEKFRMMTESASDVIWVLDPTTLRFTYVSPSVLHLTGYTAEETLTLPLEAMFPSEWFNRIQDTISKLLPEFLQAPQSTLNHIDEFQQRCKSGSLLWIETSSKLHLNAAGKIEVIGVSRDIQKRKQVEREVLYLGLHDQLTGLYNRRFYEQELLRINTPEKHPITLAMADVNGLKLINDAFGHQAGDVLLKTFATILQQTCRDQDSIARIGGDEFIIIMPNTNEHEARGVISGIQSELARYKSQKTPLSVSFGSHTKTSWNESFDFVYKLAEDRMYKQKIYESDSHKGDTVRLIVKTIHEKSAIEREHAERVSELCKRLGIALKLRDEDVKELTMAGLFHDIGKIGIDEALLNKDSPLTEEELMELRRHSDIGYQILRSVNAFTSIANAVLAHHERVDGLGYPKGLKAADIPFMAKIISVADAYDSMLRRDRFSKPLTNAEAVEELKRGMDHQFDAVVTRTFLEEVLGNYHD